MTRTEDRQSVDIDVRYLGSTYVKNPGRESRVIEEGVLHSNGGLNERDDVHQDWCDFCKDVPENFCLTIDLRPVNTATKPMTWPMPNIETKSMTYVRHVILFQLT